MFELADYLVGIYKVDDCTRSLTIQNFDKQRVLGIGEKEGEKENQANNYTLLESPEKQAGNTTQADATIAGSSSLASQILSQLPVPMEVQESQA